MGDQDLIQFLKNTDLFMRLPDQNLKLLLPFIKIKTFQKGDWILKERDIGEDLYFIKSGQAEVVKGDENPVQIAILNPGEWTGEMSLIERQKRSASVRALTTTEVLILLVKDLQAATGEEKALYAKIIQHIGKQISQRLRNVDEGLITTLKERLQLIRLQDEIGKLLILTFIFVAIYLNLITALNAFGPGTVSTFNAFFFPGTITLFGVVSLLLMYFSSNSFAFYGITLKNGWRYGLEAVVLSIPGLLFLILLKWFLISFIPKFEGIPLLRFSMPDQTVSGYLLLIAVYIILVPIQEITARCLLQTTFRNFFQGPNRVFYAILFSNILFSLFHSVADAWFALITFIFGIYWGYIFERQKSIVGCSVSHALLGGAAYFIFHFEEVIGIAILNQP